MKPALTLSQSSMTYYLTLPAVDSTTQNGTLLFTDDATIQCVAVSVSLLSPGSTDESCLTLTLSTTTTVTGLTLSPFEATVCVVYADGECSISIRLTHYQLIPSCIS